MRHRVTIRSTADGARVVVRVWLPDRPGALGLVASRIGAIGGDIVGVDVLERSEHVAVDEFAVVLPEHRPRQAARARDRRGRRRVGRGVGPRRALPRPAPRRARVGRARRATPTARERPLVPARRTRPQRSSAPTGRGRCADATSLAAIGADAARPSVLDALATGTARRPRSRPATPGPTTSRSRPCPRSQAVLLVGRDGHPFRRRERRQLLALARIADRVAALIDVSSDGPRRDRQLARCRAARGSRSRGGAPRSSSASSSR